MTTFEAHCREGALRFLHTALVIDDRAEMGNESEVAEPKVAAKASTGILAKQPVKPKKIQAPVEVVEEKLGEDSVSSAGFLNAKALTDAFLGKEIICGVHRPEGEKGSVDLAVKAATRADIVVIDWLLEAKSSAKAKEIVKKILMADAAEHGRARLVAIYTSEPGRADVAKELFEALEAEQVLQGRLKLSDDGLSIFGIDTRISIVNKSGTPHAQDVLPITETDLPDHLVDQFVQLTDGLLSNFAVSSVAAIRRGAHHVLALFSKDIDGVFVAHRCSIKNPAEATDLALALVENELLALIENAAVPEMTLDASVIDTWLDREGNNGRTFATDKARLPIELVKDLTRQGHKRLANKVGQMQVGRDQAPKDAITPSTITNAFYDDEAIARSAARRLSRLANFKREAGRLRPADKFQPVLTLGTLLRVRKDLFAGDDVGCDYLLCMQPTCDAVRLEGPTPFPFQRATYNEARFNLIVNEEGADGYLQLDLKPRDMIILQFAPTDGGDTVLAARDASGDFLFSDTTGRKFQWMGDMANMKAQGFASDVAANQHRVGGDDLEWLRLGSSGKIKPDKK